jgi:hypothetical protein
MRLHLGSRLCRTLLLRYPYVTNVPLAFVDVRSSGCRFRVFEPQLRSLLPTARPHAKSGAFTPSRAPFMETPLTPLSFAARARRIYANRDATIFEGERRRRGIVRRRSRASPNCVRRYLPARRRPRADRKGWAPDVAKRSRGWLTCLPHATLELPSALVAGRTFDWPSLVLVQQPSMK